MSRKLKEYASRRKFGETPEPPPEPSEEGNPLSFVVHKHAARALHYDLRLELEGVLKSWAVPKGPSLDPSTKRLAIRVEDHPLDYRHFEGLIPEGNYGAGGMILWDRGIYAHPSGAAGEENRRLLREGLEKGDLKFILAGEKLRGEFALVKAGKDENAWLLLKKKDRYATRENLLEKNRSVLSGRTLESLFEAGPQSSGIQARMARTRLREALEAEDLSGVPLSPLPHLVKPMLATLIREPFDSPDWIFEVKWDGYRAIAEIRHDRADLYTRNRISLAQKFAPIVESLRKFEFEAVLDGEIVVVDSRGHPDFQMLQDYGKPGGGHLLYYVFDLLHFQGHDLTGLPLIRRKELLKKVLPPVANVKFSEHVEREGILFFKAAREQGLEGIVAKSSLSPYRPGRRSRQWLKVKTRLTQEAVIAGFTAPRGGRRNFGALVLGVYERGELIFIGHVGGGFSGEMLGELSKRLAPLIRRKCPFKREPETNMPVTWVKPELVCEVIFREWTHDGILRQPVFLRLREDKTAREISRETESPLKV